MISQERSADLSRQRRSFYPYPTLLDGRVSSASARLTRLLLTPSEPITDQDLYGSA